MYDAIVGDVALQTFSFPPATYSTRVPVAVQTIGDNGQLFLVAVGDPQADRVHVRVWSQNQDFAGSFQDAQVNRLYRPQIAGQPLSTLGTIIDPSPEFAEFGSSLALDTLGGSDSGPVVSAYLLIGAPVGNPPGPQVTDRTGQVYSVTLTSLAVPCGGPIFCGETTAPQPMIADDSVASALDLRDLSRFGHSVDIKRTTGASGFEAVAIVGEPVRALSGATGRAHLFSSPNNAAWTAEFSIDDAATDLGAADIDGPFGFAVALAGDELATTDEVVGVVSRPRDIQFDIVELGLDRNLGILIDANDPPLGKDTAEPILENQADSVVVPDAFVIGFDQTTLSWQLSEVLIGSNLCSDQGALGHVVDTGGGQILLGDPLKSAFGAGDGAVYIYDLADSSTVTNASAIFQDPSMDLSRNGIPDAQELSSFDFPTGCSREVIVLVDTSQTRAPGVLSRQEKLDAAFQLAAALQSSVPGTLVHVIGIGDRFSDSSGTQNALAAQEYSNMVPASPLAAPGCVQCDSCTDFVAPSVELAEPRYNSNTEGSRENWGGAAAMLAKSFDWSGSVDRSIVVLTDEWACLGHLPVAFPNCADPYDPERGLRDLEVAASAGNVLRQYSVRGHVIAMPMLGDSFCFNVDEYLKDQAIAFSAASYAGVVGSGAFNGYFESTTAIDIVDQADDMITGSLAQALMDVPAECCEGDVTGDGAVDLADLNAVLAAFGNVAHDGQDPLLVSTAKGGRRYGDATGDGFVNLADLNLVLAKFGTDCNIGTSQSFSMSTTDPEELPVTVWLMLKDHLNANDWIDQIQQFEPADQKESTDDLKEWVDDWEGDSPE